MTTTTTDLATTTAAVITLLQREFPMLRKLPLSAQTPLLSAGLLDSFAVVTLVASLEETFGIAIDVEVTGLDVFETPLSMATMCLQHKERADG